MTSLRIHGGQVVAHGGVLDGADVLVEDGHIVAVGETVAGARELDARGCYVLPGGVDPHTHVYEGLATAPLAAVRSGTTELAAYAAPEPGERVEDACARWDALAADAPCPIEPLATVYEPDSLNETSFAALAARGVRGIKLFLAYRELGLDADDEVLLRALFWGKTHDVVPRLHCENAGAIHVLRERLRSVGDIGIDAHPRSRPPLVEEEGVRRALDLARLADAPVYIVHVSTAGAVAAIRQARADGVDVIGETCPQYLLLDERVYCGPLAPMGVISPPLRSRAHAEAVWEGVLDGTLTTIGSDHSHRGSRPAVAFDELVSGGPGVAARMPLMLTAALRDARLSIELATSLLCAGRVVEAGAPADLVVWDPEPVWTLTPATLAEGLDASVWDGTEVRGRPRTVLRNGEVVA
ncbi:MAG: dihydropyrimidinase [Gaiellales bacterium]|nr:dihydropyrimidinase [Gaiellales bacterium]